MSESTQPRPRGPHSIAAAVIGARLNLNPQRGDEHAKMLWFAVLSHTPWDGADRPTYATDTTLGMDVGLCLTHAERAVQRLKNSDMLATPRGQRPRHKTRKWGRLLVPRLASPVKVLIPSRGEMTNLWITCREIRKRPASLVTLAVGLHVIACHAAGHRVTGRTQIPGTMADVRRFVGARKGHAWTKRVRDLETLGLLTRDGRTAYLEPMATWDQTARSLANVAQREVTPAKSSPTVAPMGCDPRWEHEDQAWP